MAIDSVSSYSSGFASRPPDPAPDATQAVQQQNDAGRIAQAAQGASPQYVNAPQQADAAPAGGGGVDAGAVVNDPEGSIQRAQTLIQNTGSSSAPTEAQTRRASEAYQAAANAQSQISQQQQQQGAQSLNVLA
jgi:hypothetical protein